MKTEGVEVVGMRRYMFSCETIRLAVGQDDISVNQIGMSNAGMTYSESCNDDFFASEFSLLEEVLKMDCFLIVMSLLSYWDF